MQVDRGEIGFDTCTDIETLLSLKDADPNMSTIRDGEMDSLSLSFVT